MMRYAAAVSLVLALGAASPAVAQQAASVTYQAPAGWTQATNPANGIVTLMPRGVPFLRMVALNVLPPEPFNGSAEAFHQEIVRRAMSAGQLLEQPRTGTLGAFQVTRFRQRAPNGAQLWVSLYSARWADRGQAITFLANALDMANRYLPAADSMVSRIAVPRMLVGEAPPPASGPPQSPPPAAQPGQPAGNPNIPVYQPGAAPPPATTIALNGSFADYRYWQPEGWTANASGPGMQIVSPPSQTGERCTLGIWPPAPARGDLFSDADGAWRQFFAEFDFVPFSKTPLVHGVSADGWEYVLLQREITPKGRPEPNLLGMVLLARIGNRDATFTWFSKAQLYSQCVDFYTGLPQAWPRFVASLRFNGWSAPPGSGFAQKIIGSWESMGTSSGGGAVIQYAFNPSGRYAFTGVGQRYLALSDFTAAVWTSTAFGDGTYTIAGNDLTMKADRDGKVDHYWVRYEQQSEDGGRSWSDMLYLMQPEERCRGSGACPIEDTEIGLKRMNR